MGENMLEAATGALWIAAQCVLIFAFLVAHIWIIGGGVLLASKSWERLRFWWWRDFYRQRNLEELQRIERDKVARRREAADRENVAEAMAVGARIEFNGPCFSNDECDPYCENRDEPLALYCGQYLWKTDATDSARDYAMGFDSEVEAAQHFLRVRAGVTIHQS